MTLDEIERIVYECLNQLFTKDISLLQHDVSERAITHKLAEYIQIRFPGLNVDCEYNRNATVGDFATKQLKGLRRERISSLKESNEEDLLAISTYPDIIVHRRTINDENLLVIEVKKRNSNVGSDFDHKKLSAFTDKGERNLYHYSYGVFIMLDTGKKN